MSDAPYPYRTNDRRVIPWLLLMLALLFGAFYAAAHAFTSDRVAQGTTVSGVEVGGLTNVAAEAKLRRDLVSLSHQPIVVTANGAREAVQPARAGLRVDVPASMAQVRAGHSWDPQQMWSYLTGGRDLPAVVRVDPAALAAAVDRVAGAVDEPATEGRVWFGDGEAHARYPHNGVALDRAAAATALRGAFLAGPGPLTLPTRVDEPEIGKRDVSRAMADFANPAVSAPVIFQLRGKNVVLRPADYASALSMTAKGGRLVPVVDDSRLLQAVRPAMKKAEVAPRDADVRIVGGRPRVVPAKRGATFDPKDVTDNFLALVSGHDQGRQLAVKSVVVKPKVSTREVERLRIRQKVSEFTTHFPYAAYRNMNLGRAAQLVNGTILEPGDTFSLNHAVGERTSQNGFTKGFIISDGVYKEDYGGGVSQVATTLFNAAFFAGLADIEHKPHSFYIDRYPVGREATVAWPTVDLKFKNTTPYGVLVQAWIDRSTPSSQGAMHVRMWSTKYWDIKTRDSDRYNVTKPATRHLSGQGCVPHAGYGGFDIDVYRYFYRHGSSKLDHQETMHTSYTPSDSVVCS